MSSALIMVAGALLIVGFSEAADYGFGTPRAYAVIIVGAVFFCVSIVHYLRTTRVAIIPAVSLRSSPPPETRIKSTIRHTHTRTTCVL